MSKFTYVFTENGKEYDRCTVQIPKWAMGSIYEDKPWRKVNKRVIKSKKDYIIIFKNKKYQVTKEPYKELGIYFESYLYDCRERCYNTIMYLIEDKDFKSAEARIEQYLKDLILEDLNQ